MLYYSIYLTCYLIYASDRVFMGSEKYPDENEYDSYVTAHGGSCNACTEGTTLRLYYLLLLPLVAYHSFIYTQLILILYIYTIYR